MTRLWHVNTARQGGGVAEILDALTAQNQPGSLEHRRFVTTGGGQLFQATKRLHHRLHGVDRGPLPDAEEHAAFEEFGVENAKRFLEQIEDGDAVLLHDPQTLPMASVIRAAGIHVTWRCHIGTPFANQVRDETWDYLSRFWPSDVDLIFSDASMVPPHAAGHRVDVIAPSIDPTAEKNRPMPVSEVARILAAAGLDGPGAGVSSAVEAYSEGAPGADPIVVQVSRWDPLKDMGGVLRAFADSDLVELAHLVLCGPSPSGIADDPEAGTILADVVAQWEALPAPIRRRVHLLCPDLADQQGNARLVNALQRRASVVVQRSVQEGFGLTVTEAMLKGRPIVASRVGGIPAQITHGETGLLLDDPGDDEQFTGLVSRLLTDPVEAARLGDAAAVRAGEHFTTAREAADHERIFGVGRGW